MKTILTLLSVVACCVSAKADTDAMLCGIRIVETRDQLHPPRGKLGERGPYQFRRSTWRMHTSSSFDLAENRAVANKVAKRHYQWIQEQLLANGIEPSPYHVAMAWNAGVNAVIRGQVPAVARDYATRVLNIAASIADIAPTTETVESKPKPAWKAPVLVMEDSPSEISPSDSPVMPATQPPEEEKPATIIARSVAEPPTSTLMLSLELAAADDTVEVRYHNNPITLAFSRNTPDASAQDALPQDYELAASTPVLRTEIDTASVRL